MGLCDFLNRFRRKPKVSEEAKKHHEALMAALSKYPRALTPVWNTSHPNEEITVYDGKVEIAQNGVTMLGNARIFLRWHPACGLRFNANLTEALSTTKYFIKNGPVEINLPEKPEAKPIEATITSIRDMFARTNVAGRVREIVVGEGLGLTTLKFHAPNFTSFKAKIISNGKAVWGGRHVLEGQGWRVILDEQRDGVERSELTEAAGTAITHVGQIEKIDGTEFNAADTLELVECLSNFLSFAKSHWTGPLLFAGFDKTDALIYERHFDTRVTPERSLWHWLDDMKDDTIESLFPEFVNKWFDPKWQDILRICVYFFVDANLPEHSAEGGIIEFWAIFEALGWIEFVETNKYTADQYYGLRSDSKLAELLNLYNIDTTLPSELSRLTAEAAKESLTVRDGAAAVAVIRNGFAHPSPRNRRLLATTVDLTEWTFLLARKYAGLCLLRQFHYQGSFINYFKKAEWLAGAAELVPWSNKSKPTVAATPPAAPTN
jgi:hypothetical protein